MASRWYALYRPGREEPEAADYDKSDLWSLALRRAPLTLTAEWGGTSGDRLVPRQAAVKRLKRRGWRLEPLPDRFWLLHPHTLRRLESEIRILQRQLERAQHHAPMEFLQELAEDRHELRCVVERPFQGETFCTGTLRTCPDRLCDQAATLLGR